MPPFKHNKIFLDSETVSERLRLARQARGLKAEKVAERLNINPRYIDALEKGDFEKLPKGIYAQNFLREYALFLNLDYNELKKIFEKELEVGEEPLSKKPFPRQVAKRHYFLAVPKMIRNLIIFITILVCFTYLGLAMKKNFSQPSLYVESPAENLITSQKTVEINGRTEAESQIIINGEPVLSDSAGRFSERVNLKEGINIITITAKKKYGRENTVKRQVLVKEG
jgi:cytoskeletal protein RodZ